MLRIDFVTLFPEMVLGALEHSIPSRAARADLVEFRAVNPRDFTFDNHKTVDDNPYGGGPGMLMKIEPISRAMASLELPKEKIAVVLTDPTGPLFTQAHAREFSNLDRLVFLCGHYEGFDHRIEELYATHPLSIGDYVRTGGEFPALVMADAAVRLIPGALGSAESLTIDSFEDGLLSAPQYTRPEDFQGHKVPSVLLSGNHAEIRKWKRKEALRITRERRPDLFGQVDLSKEDRKLLSQLDDLG